MDDRTLCELAAIHIFGWKWIDDRRTGQPILVDSDTEWVETFDLGTRVDPLQSLPDYLTGDGMLRVIEKMRELGFDCVIQCDSQSVEAVMYCGEFIQHEHKWNRYSEFSDTAPRAVLPAALRAMGVDLGAEG